MKVNSEEKAKFLQNIIIRFLIMINIYKLYQITLTGHIFKMVCIKNPNLLLGLLHEKLAC